MSFKHLATIWELDCDATGKLVLVVLAETADFETGECHVRPAVIAERSALTERTVRTKLQELVDAGHLRVQIEYTSKGGRKANRYFIIAGTQPAAPSVPHVPGPPVEHGAEAVEAGPMATETAWAQNRGAVERRLIATGRLDNAAYILALVVAGVAGPGGNANMHYQSIKSWLAAFWDDERHRHAAFKAFCDKVFCEEFTAALACAKIWETILGDDGLKRWVPDDEPLGRPSDFGTL